MQRVGGVGTFLRNCYERSSAILPITLGDGGREISLAGASDSKSWPL